jgi:hypothetical protein
LFLTIAARIVEPDFGGEMKISKLGNNGAAPTL